MMSHEILRSIVRTITEQSTQFAIIMDGTQDVRGKEQESICIRYVDKNLEVHETFVGLYEPSSTTGETLAGVVEDVMTRFQLPVTNLRGQTYDGASNMSGHYSGCQAIIATKQPLAIYVHCGAHCTNLVIQYTVACNPMLRDTIQWIQELGALYSRSLNYKKAFADVSTTNSYRSIKPLCPTRWLCRTPAIRCVVTQYKAVLRSLIKFSQSTKTESATKAAGLLDRFEKGQTLLMLSIALTVFTPLENLNRSLQSESATLGGMLAAAQITLTEFQRLRNVKTFRKLFVRCNKTVHKLDLEPVATPRQRKPPGRYSGPAPAYHAATAEEHYRAIFFLILDNVVEQLQSRFDVTAPGLSTYIKLENMILHGTMDGDLIDSYPELDKRAMSVQLPMFLNQFKCTTVEQARVYLQDMCPEVRRLFTQVEQLVRLLLVCPASSCSAERSFSALRRLKTWLRSNMTQKRLNSVAVCHVNKQLLDALDLTKLAADFAGQSEIRRNIFGNFH